jgi:MFS family permease
MAASWRAATLAPFKSRIFVAIWTASLISNLGSLIQAVGASWLMTSIARSPDMVALVQASTALPILLLSLPSGAIADIWDRRVIMLIAQSLMLTVSIALAAVAYFGHITPWMLLSLTFLLGCGAALYGPAWQSSVGEQVPREEVPAAVSLNSLAFNLARTAGPAIGGVIVATAGPPAAFLVNAATYIALIVVLSSWRRKKPVHTLPPEPVHVAMQAGLRYVLLSPAIRTVLVRGFFFGLMGSALWALMPVIARDLLNGGALTYGVLFGAFGIGAVIGALLATSIRQRLSTETIIALSSLAFGLTAIAIAFSPYTATTMLLLLFSGASWVLALSTFNIIVQISSPRWVVGRALAIYQMLTFGGLALGSWLFGELAQRDGIRTALIAAGVLMTLSTALGTKLRLPRVTGLNLDPFRKTLMPPNMTSEVVPQSGPVVITVEYHIAPEDRDAFMLLMREMRRIRRRDGARHWILLQDIDDPSRWTERFQSATWLDYLRQRQRFTMADREVSLRLHAFHRGEQMPKVRHLLERTPTAASYRKTETEQIMERASVIDPNLPPSTMPVAVGEPQEKPSRAAGAPSG